MFLGAGWGAPVQSQVNELKFEHLDINDGLSHNTVLCALQDSRGYLWFGTMEGLNRYDGYRFTVFKHEIETEECISDNQVHALFEDSRGNLWIGTNKGLNRYHREKNRVLPIPLLDPDGKPLFPWPVAVYALQEDAAGQLWIGTGAGLFSCDPASGRCRQRSVNPEAGNSDARNRIMAIAPDDRGRLWIGTRAGLLFLDPSDHSFIAPSLVLGEEDAARIASLSVRTIHPDRSGHIWIGTEGDGLVKVTPETGDIEFYRSGSTDNGLPGDLVRAVHEDREGRLWVGTREGLCQLDRRQGRFISYTHDSRDPQSIRHNSIRAIVEDKAGALWFGSYAGGINFVHANRIHIRHIEEDLTFGKGLSHPVVSAFAEDQDGGIWVGTEGGGLDYWNRREHTFLHFQQQPGKNGPAGNNIKALLLDRDQNLWIGTYTGLSFFDRKRKRFTNFHYTSGEVNGLPHDQIYAICQTPDGTIWIGANGGGLSYFDASTRQFVRQIPGLDSIFYSAIKNITVLFADREGNLWVGSENGLACLRKDRSSFEFFQYQKQVKGSLRSNFILSVFEDSKGRIWIGTKDGGLHLLDRHSRTFSVWNESNGLPNNSIEAILEDQRGYLWISTNKGVARLSLLPDGALSADIKKLDVADGLQSNQFNKSAGLMTRDGALLFGGINGFNLLFPDTLPYNSFLPPVFLSGFQLFNKPAPIGGEGSPLDKDISETDHLTLNHRQSVFTLEFVALNFVQPAKNQYAFKLEGYDADWRYIGNERRTTYTNLPAGHYVFRVKAANNDGLWNETGASLRLTILPPWWKTWWAYAGYAALVIGLFILYHRVKLHQLNLRNQLVREEEMHQLKLNFYTNISHEFRTPLTLILGPLEDILRSRKKSTNPLHGRELDMVYRNAQRLLHLINQLMDFRKIETGQMTFHPQIGNVVPFIRQINDYFIAGARRHRIRFRFYPQKEAIFLAFDADKLEKVIYNLLSNAFKYTPDGGSISVDVQEKYDPQRDPAEYLEISVTDTGPGIAEKDLGRLFDRFYQAEEPFSHFRRPGSGIGLALSKDLVDMHGGCIFARSQPGRGSTFVIQLPLVHPAGMKEDASKGREENVSLPNQQGAPSVPGTLQAPSWQMRPGKRPEILIVEDDADLRSYLRRSLEAHFSILEAANGLEGFQIAHKHLPDLIISDIRMPEMDGFTLCQKIKTTFLTSHIPFIMLTSHVSEESQVKGLDLGADDYVTKPFSGRLLHSRSLNLIRSRETLRNRFMQDLDQGPESVTHTPVDAAFLERAVQVVERNLPDNAFSVEDFAREMAMSRSNLHLKLKSLTNQSASRFITSIRLKEAARLLKEGKLNVSEIAWSVGFSDPKYFSRLFHQQFGRAPSEFIRSGEV